MFRDGQTQMAKVTYNHLIDSVSGKLCNDPKSPIFARRKDSGTKYVYHRDNPYTGPASDSQKLVRNKFKAAHQAVKTILNDPQQVKTLTAEWKANPGKYATLRGYVFAKEFANL